MLHHPNHSLGITYRSESAPEVLTSLWALVIWSSDLRMLALLTRCRVDARLVHTITWVSSELIESARKLPNSFYASLKMSSRIGSTSTDGAVALPGA